MTYHEPQAEEIVGQAIRQALAGKLDLVDDLEAANVVSVPITDELLSRKPYLGNFAGGVLISCQFGTGKTDNLDGIQKRFEQLKLKNEFEKFDHSNTRKVFAPDNENVDGKPVAALEVAVVSDIMYAGDDDEEWQAFRDNELGLFKGAMSLKTSFSRLVQIDPSVGGKSKNDAMIAIVFSLIAIIIYIWIRFGNVRFGMAAVVALIHDVSIAMGMVAASAWLANTAIGKALLISDFKIDLPMIAAFLTVIGYSLNDTIVIFDRVRENRGKLATLSSGIIDASINQTVSRTVITSFTTLLVLLVMYIWGGPALRGFNYVLIIGVLVGTYSSVGIAAPLLYGARDQAGKQKTNNK